MRLSKPFAGIYPDSITGWTDMGFTTEPDITIVAPKPQPVKVEPKAPPIAPPPKKEPVPA